MHYVYLFYQCIGKHTYYDFEENDDTKVSMAT